MKGSTSSVYDPFDRRIHPRWSRLCLGGGGLVLTKRGLRLLMPPVGRHTYADAQIDDCQGKPRSGLPWHPPLRLRLQACLAPTIRGTAGFGFWNNPLAPTGGLPSLPQAVWFLYASPPSAMPFAYGVPGHGWKAACIDATGPAALAWAPLAPVVMLLNRWAPFYRTVWPRVQRHLRIAEALLPTPHAAWQQYELEWHRDRVVWRINGSLVFASDVAPIGPLGFVAWVDNQWAAADPRGRLGWGLCNHPQTQWLDLAHLRIEPL